MESVLLGEQTGGRKRGTGRVPAAAFEFEGLKWLDDGKYPLDWNGPTSRVFTRFRDEDLDRPIIDHLERVASRYRDRIAITDSDTHLSYAQLWDGLSGLAETIAAETKPGELVGILLPACSMYPVAILACLAAGRPFVALDPHYPDNWLDQVLEDAQPALIIAGEDVPRGVERVAAATRVIHLNRPPQSAGKGWRPTQHNLDQPACVLFTSGSTGRPKGIVNSQRNLLQRAAQSINAAHINAEDRFLTLASPCTIVGVRDIVTALLAGASVHLLDPQRAGAREILNVIRAEAVTILFAFPALLRSVLAPRSASATARSLKNGDERAGDALRLVRIGGDTTLWSDIDLLRRWLAPPSAIQLIYAATEAPMMQWFVDGSCRNDDARIPIGYPLPGNRLAVIDEHGRNTAPGEAGELIVESPYVALGLWSNGRCAAGSFESKGAPSCRIFRTGDLVRQRPDGLLERIGRKDRQVKIRGTRVDPDGVEAALRRHPLVRDAAALARPAGARSASATARSLENGEVTLVAYVTAHDEARPDQRDSLLDELNQLMRSAPPAMRPARLYLTGSIPRLPSSKLDLRALMSIDKVNVQNEHGVEAPARPRPASRNAVAVDGDGIARTVAQVWQDVLHTPVGSPMDDDDFFASGGDSLKAISFVNGIERALGLELSLTLISESPKFGRLCEALREHRSARYVPLVPLKPGEGAPPVFFIHGLGGNVAGFFPMARRMSYPGAIIGIQARGLRGQEPTHGTVEEMAAEYLREVKARQPNGPYFLCGYSFGGVVAFEMARRLSQAGDEVGLVGLFDTMMSPVRWPVRAWLSIVCRRIVQLAVGMRSAPVQTWPAAVWKICGDVRQRLRDYASSTQPEGTPLPSFLKSAPARVLKVATNALTASARYRPGFYPGELTLFSPAAREPGLPSLQSIWRKHARALSIVEIPGAHSTMLFAPNAESAAEALTRCLPRPERIAERC